jgi:hypothetical protein
MPATGRLRSQCSLRLVSEAEPKNVENDGMKTGKFVGAAGILLIAVAAWPAGKSSSTEASLGIYPEYHVVHGWPVLPEGEVLGSVAGVGVDSHGSVFVFHRAGRAWPKSDVLELTPIPRPTVDVFNGQSGTLLRCWGANRFAMPHGLTIDGHDNVWLTDVALQQVCKVSPEGKLLLTLGERGVAGDDEGHFNRPTAVAVAGDGSFYVSGQPLT